MEIPIIIVSHRRAGCVTTHRYVENASVCVPESQAAEYEKKHPDLPRLVHPDDVLGLPAKRQWIYKQVGDVMMLDDDSVGLFRRYQPRGRIRHFRLSPRRAWELIQATAIAAREAGAFLFGFGSHTNPIACNFLSPIRLGGYSPGGAIGILAGSKLWWPTDTTLPIDDYWICCLNAFYHRYAWYDERFAFGFRGTWVNAGGMAEFRSDEAEVRATEYLVQHFGAMIRPGQRKAISAKAGCRHRRGMRVPWKH